MAGSRPEHVLEAEQEMRGAAAMRFLERLPRFVFFTGKGGVGKTSLACATGLRLAASGKRVLLVSTDPAANIGQVFGITIGNTITDVPSVPGLTALEIDPEQATDAYRERLIAPVRDVLPETEVVALTESLSGSCTTEIASFDEFTALLTDDAAYGRFDHILFDTAPTGHTLRLLQLPGSWTEYLTTGGDASCLGPLSGLEKQKTAYADAVEALTDPSRTRLVLVTRAQRSSLNEIDRTFTELAAIGIREAHLVINGILPDAAGDEPIAAAVRAREAAAIAAMPSALRALPCDHVELQPENMVGIAALSTLFAPAARPATAARAAGTDPGSNGPLVALVDEIEHDGHGLVMCMGKGGVGKTTIAAAIAVALAERGHDVLLTTTDPAAHLNETLAGDVPHLTVSRIDPREAVQRYRAHAMATKGKSLDEEERAALAEDLMSPCTDEVAVFHEFSRAIHEARRRFVVIDTAPTGHTLLLLDTAGSYHRDITRQLGGTAGLTTPLMRLQDGSLTKIILITLAETTPVLEAEALQRDLERADIHPWAWVVNSSIAAGHPESPFLAMRAAHEFEQIARVRAIAGRVALVPLLAQEPVGASRLLELAGGAHHEV